MFIGVISLEGQFPGERVPPSRGERGRWGKWRGRRTCVSVDALLGIENMFIHIMSLIDLAETYI